MTFLTILRPPNDMLDLPNSLIAALRRWAAVVLR